MKYTEYSGKNNEVNYNLNEHHYNLHADWCTFPPSPHRIFRIVTIALYGTYINVILFDEEKAEMSSYGIVSDPIWVLDAITSIFEHKSGFSKLALHGVQGVAEQYKHKLDCPHTPLNTMSKFGDNERGNV